MKREEKLEMLAEYFKDHSTIPTKVLSSMNIQYTQIQKFIETGILVQAGWGHYKKGKQLQIVEETTSKKKRRKSKNSYKLDELECYLQKNYTIDAAKLSEMGISSYSIKKCIEDGILVRVSRGVYQSSASLSLDKLASASLEENTFDIPSDKTFTFEEFEQLLLEEKYQEATYEGIVLEDLTQEELHLFNTYLILLSQVVCLSTNEAAYIQKLTVEDCKTYEASSSTNDHKIRFSIFNKRFTSAMRQIMNEYEDLDNLSKTNQIFLGLLKEISKINQNRRKLEIELQQKGEYLELQKVLIEQQKKGTINENEQALLQLVNLICSDETIPYSRKKCYSVFEGIECQNYEKALEWDENYAKKNNLQEEHRLLTLALKKVIEKIELQKRAKQNKCVASDIISSNSEEKVDSTINHVTIPQILKTLWDGNVEESILLLKQYLEIQNQTQYFPLLQGLIELAVLDQDLFYRDFYEALLRIRIGDYTYSMTPYLLGFASSVDEDFEKAKIYLKILDSGKSIGIECYYISELKQKLENVWQGREKRLS